MDKFFSSLSRGKIVVFAIVCIIACTALIIGIVAKVQYDAKHLTGIQPTDAGSVTAIGAGKLGGLESGSTGGGGSTEQSGAASSQKPDSSTSESTIATETTASGNDVSESNREDIDFEKSTLLSVDPEEDSQKSASATSTSNTTEQVSESFTSNLANTEGTVTETSKPLVAEFKKISIEGATIEIGEIPHYTGSPVEPELSVKLASGIKISKDTDYTVSYSNNDHGGTATATITGIRDYEGTITQDFEVISDVPEEVIKPEEETSAQEGENLAGETTNSQIESDNNDIPESSNVANIPNESADNAEKIERSQEKLASIVEEKVEEVALYEEGLEKLVGSEKYAEYVANVEKKDSHFAAPDMSVPHMQGSLRVKAKKDRTIDEINNALAGIDGIYTKNITANDMSFGWFGIRCSDDTDLAALIETLSHIDVFDNAQLDCVYFTSDEDPAKTKLTFSYGNFAEPDVDALFEKSVDPEPIEEDQSKVDLTDPGFGEKTTLMNPRKSAPGGRFLLTFQSVNDPVEELSTNSVSDNTIDPASSWELSATKAPYAWSLVPDSSNVAVAVMDTGCLINSRDLSDNIIGSYNAVYQREGNITDVDINNYHGTHVCGTISAKTYNSFGTAGISNNAKLYPVCIAAWDNVNRMVVASDTTLASAYDHIIKKKLGGTNIRVANVSVGSPRGSTAFFDTVEDLELYEKISQANATGILTVTAAGNDWLNGNINGNADMSAYLEWPSMANDRGLNVIALTREINETTGEYEVVRADYSNCEYVGNNVVTIAAPGSDIASVGQNDTVTIKSGTSQAAPCVSGVAALVFAANNTLDVADVKEIIEQTAQDIVYEKERTFRWYDEWTEKYKKVTKIESADIKEDQYTGYGMIDAEAAVREAQRRMSHEEPFIPDPNTTPADEEETIVDAANTYEASEEAAESSLDNGASENVSLFDDENDGPAITGSSDSSSDSVNSSGSSSGTSGNATGVSSGNSGSSSNTSGSSTGSSSGNSGSASSGSASASTNTSGKTNKSGSASTGKKAESTTGTSRPNQNTAKNLNDLSIASPASKVYDGVEYKPFSKSFVANGVTYKENQDYTLRYSNNKNAGTGYVNIIGKGRLSGNRSFSFKISKRNIKDMIKEVKGAYYYNAGRPVPVQISMYALRNGMQPKQGVDYDLAKDNSVNVGSYKLTISGKGNYEGKCTFTYKILPCDIKNWYGSLTIPNYNYTGKAITPVGSRAGLVQGVNYVLNVGRDVVVKYKNNVKVGVATVTITGKGNYTGQVVKKFKILKKNTLKSGNVSYKVHTGAKSKVLKKAQTSKAWKSLGTKLKGAGKITFEKISGSGVLKINKNNGKITVAKGTKRSTYTMKVRITASGNRTYNSAWVVKSVKVRVVK